MMEQMILQPVAGANNIAIFPYIRKIDLMSSNSYIISGPDQIAVIDPGGLEEQILILEEEIERLQAELLRPVMIYLTHVHLDHWLELTQCSTCSHLRKAFLAVQNEGADALERCDSQATLAELLGRPMIATAVDLRLLPQSGQETEGPLKLGRWTLPTSSTSTEIFPRLTIHSQEISLGEGENLEIFHTPGHSPDGITLRAGSLLMVGDLFFAPNPGMAGAPGWNKQDLLDSIQKIMWIIDNRNITLCCSGHGRTIDAQTAMKTLKIMYQDAASLEGLEEITPQWAKNTAAFAQYLMSELERIFIIIAGRLAYISHVLHELEEDSEAQETEGIINADLLDDLFSDFHAFVGELRAGRRLDLELVHKAGKIMTRLDGLFSRKSLFSVMSQSLIRRAERLLNDYASTYRGFRPPYYANYMDLNQAIQDILRELEVKPYREEAIIQAESEEEYTKALKARIAYVDIFENVSISFNPDSRRPFAHIDKERFADSLTDIMERFAGQGVTRISLGTAHSDEWCSIRITGGGNRVADHPLNRSIRFFERSLALCGGLMEIGWIDGRPCAKIEFSALSDEMCS